MLAAPCTGRNTPHRTYWPAPAPDGGPLLGPPGPPPGRQTLHRHHLLVSRRCRSRPLAAGQSGRDRPGTCPRCGRHGAGLLHAGSHPALAAPRQRLGRPGRPHGEGRDLESGEVPAARDHRLHRPQPHPDLAGPAAVTPGRTAAESTTRPTRQRLRKNLWLILRHTGHIPARAADHSPGPGAYPALGRSRAVMLACPEPAADLPRHSNAGIAINGVFHTAT
ncbi:hypothetical protein ACFFX0_32560 [Citricoccus parietis]|uniref:Uncharacterized protein n=1 Tax=Citricoccus parietis TaxID=592307 RepID=A0ABV5G9L1_9MICC